VLAEIRNNPNVRKQQLSKECNLRKTSIDNIIRKLKEIGFIKRIGSKKTNIGRLLIMFKFN
ncbi:MAG: MarR family transcriptional regulator, partial [Methanobrevibacter woesei]|nr:MarR family transcriptional regulator [Methanobrevibacter woesei]